MDKLVEQIEDMWTTTEKTPMPNDFVRIADGYFKKKCVYGTTDFTPSDYATCVMIYKLYKKRGKNG